MAQRRMIAKSISTSKKVNRVSDKAALLFTWLIPHCDDFGRMDGSPDAVKAIVVPMRNWSEKQVAQAIDELSSVGLINVYKINEDFYLEITKFTDFQTFKNDRERINLYPENPLINKVIPMDSKDFQQDSYKLSEVKLSEVKESKEVSLQTPALSEFKNVKLSEDEFNKLVERLGRDPTLSLIEELGAYLASSNKRYASHYATLLNWSRRKIADRNRKSKTITSI